MGIVYFASEKPQTRQPNLKVYSQGMKTTDLWDEVLRRFGKGNSLMNAIDFYAQVIF